MFRTLLSLVVVVSVAPVLAGWEVESVGSPGWGYMPVLALDGEGHPHIVTSASGLSYTWHDGSQWQEEFIFNVSGGPQGMDITLDSDGMARVSYSYSNIGYARRIGSDAWTHGSISPMTFGLWTSIALAGDTDPVIAACTSDHLVLVEWDGASWQFDTGLSTPTTGWESQCISLALDALDRPHFAVCLIAPSGSVYHGWRDGSTWTIQQVDGAMYPEPEGTSLALDASGNPRISYNTHSEIRYAWWDGSWHVETVDALDTGTLQYGTSLALDAYGHPHIAYVSAAGDSLKYAVGDGGGWSIETVCAIPSTAGGNPSLALDSLGRPRIAFYQGWYVGLGYAWNDDPTGITSPQAPAGQLELQVTPNPFSEALSISLTAPAPASAGIRIFDATGRLVDILDAGSQRSGLLSWQPGSGLTNGVYFVVFSSGELRTVKSCLLLR